jgi:hypothetical protein
MEKLLFVMNVLVALNSAYQLGEDKHSNRAWNGFFLGSSAYYVLFNLTKVLS